MDKPAKQNMPMGMVVLRIIFWALFINYFILPMAVGASNTLMHVNLYGIHRFLQESIRWAVYVVLFLGIISIPFNLGKKPANTTSVKS